MQTDFSNFISIGAEGIFYLFLLIFTIHIVFLGYHWFNFGTSKRISTIALAAYLCGGAVIFLTLAILLGSI